MKKGVLVFIALFVMLAVGGTVFASASHTDSFTISPSFSFQHIFYTVGNYKDKNGLGFGAGVSYDHFLNTKTSIGLATSYEFFIYKDFFNYNDFKVQATVKRQILGKEGRTRLFATAGAGMDFVLRNDKDFGAYPLFNLGLETVFRCKDKTSVTLKTEAGITIQKGSVVLQANAGVGLRFSFGKALTGEKNI